MPKDTHFANGRTSSVLVEGTLLALSALTTALLFGWLLYYSSFGLDLSDEGFYLNSIANPFAYAINIPPSLFGFVYHWPYRWADGDIGALRIVNVTLTMVLGWILSFLTIRRFWTVGWPQAAILSAGIASLALVAFQAWLLTPNYYTLNFQSLLIVMIGLVLAERPGRIRQVLAAILVGLGGWCCFMAKPTTAATIGIVVMTYVAIFNRKSLLPILGAALVALALLTVTAYLIDRGITGLITRMVNSAGVEIVLGAGHEMSRIFRIDWLASSRTQFAVAVLAAISLLSTLIGFTQKLIPSLALAAIVTATTAIALLGTDPIYIKRSALFLVPAFTCLGVIFYREGLVLRTQTLATLALALIFLGLPHLFALGTNGNYWTGGSDAALFWMLAVVAFLSPLAQEGRSVATLLPLTMLAQLLAASVINADMLKPWRQVEDLRAYNAVTLLPAGGKLILSQPFHEYLTAARAQAQAAGLQAGTPVVDLSGRSPGLLYALDARAVGLPWLIGAYPGSNAVAVQALGLENCADLAKAWVLIEPDGPRQLDQASVMASFGAEQADYVTAATFETPVYNRGDYPQNSYLRMSASAPIRRHRQFLSKPVRPAALAEQLCREVRRQLSASPK